MPCWDLSPDHSDSTKPKSPIWTFCLLCWDETFLQWRLASAKMRGVGEQSSSGKHDWESKLCHSLDKHGQVLHLPEPQLKMAPSLEGG